MKKLLWIAITYQLYLVTRAVGAGSESLLAARAITQGQVPYRDFMIHVGPLMAYLFAGLYSIPSEVWPSLIFIGFNLLSAWGLYLVARRHLELGPSLAVCALFLFIIPLYGGNEMYPEVLLATCGIWGLYFAERKNWVLMSLMFILGLATKQTGILFPIGVLIWKIAGL